MSFLMGANPTGQIVVIIGFDSIMVYGFLGSIPDYLFKKKIGGFLYMLDLKTIEMFRKKERLNRAGLIKLPDGFYEQCQEAMDDAFKKQDYALFRDLQRIVQDITEVRQGKILKLAIYRSARFNALEPVSNILPHEEKLFREVITVLWEENYEIDVLLNGYYFQRE